MKHPPQTVSLGAIVVLAFVSAGAEELCFESAWAFCCWTAPPCDFGFPIIATGYSTDGSDCRLSGHDYRFEISSSATDASIHAGVLSETQPLYLWLYSSPTGYGFGLGWATLQGDLEVHDYRSLSNDVPSQFDLDSRRLDVGRFNHCPPDGYSLIGELVRDPTSVDAGSWGQVKARYRSGP